MATIGADLVRQMAAGDREAFAAFYDRYAPVVFPLILRIVRERADASDVLQEVFWEAWRDAPAYDASRGERRSLDGHAGADARDRSNPGDPPPERDVRGPAGRRHRRWRRASRRRTPPSAPLIGARS